MSQFIVEHGKHGEYYHDASTPEEFAASALAILTERFNQGYWYDEPGEEPVWEGPDLDTIKSLKDIDNDAYQAVAKKWNRHVDAKRRHKQESAFYSAVKAIVESQSTELGKIGRGRFEREVPVAWLLLEGRSDYEYERVELETAVSHL